MEGKLFQAACTGDLNALHDAVQEDAAILQKWHSSGRADTPLHLASMFGHARFVAEYMKLSSISVRQLCRLNQDGYSPLHLASANGSVEIVKVLLEFGRQNAAVEEVCMKRDRDGRTALQCAVVSGNVDVIGLLMADYPDAVMDVSGRRESVLHLAVKHHQFEVLKFLIDKMGLVAVDFLNLGDYEGNTVLHLAVAKRLLQIVEYLVKLPGLDVNVKNSNGLRAFDMITHISAPSLNDLYVDEAIRLATRDSQSNHLRWDDYRDTENRDWLREMRSGVIVMASLIATLTFQVALTPPGGVWQDTSPMTGGSVRPKHKPGTSIFYDLDRSKYNVLMWINVQAFLASISSIVGMLKPFRLTSRRWHLVLFSMYFTVISITLEFFVILMIVTNKKLLVQPICLIPVVVWVSILLSLLFGFIVRAITIRYRYKGTVC